MKSLDQWMCFQQTKLEKAKKTVALCSIKIASPETHYKNYLKELERKNGKSVQKAETKIEINTEETEDGW